MWFLEKYDVWSLIGDSAHLISVPSIYPIQNGCSSKISDTVFDCLIAYCQFIYLDWRHKNTLKILFVIIDIVLQSPTLKIVAIFLYAALSPHEPNRNIVSSNCNSTENCLQECALLISQCFRINQIAFYIDLYLLLTCQNIIAPNVWLSYCAVKSSTTFHNR